MIPGSLDGLDIPLAQLWKNYRHRLNKLSKHSFAGWILYQTVKGTLTTTLIWVPLLYHYFQK